MRVITLCLAAVIAMAFAVPVEAATVADHPAVTPYAGVKATRRDDDGFRSYAFVVGVDEKGKSDEEILRTLKVEGNVTRLAYENPPERSVHEIFANYREGLEKGGFAILFSCIEKECGPSYATSRWARVTAAVASTGPRTRTTTIIRMRMTPPMVGLRSSELQVGELDRFGLLVSRPVRTSRC